MAITERRRDPAYTHHRLLRKGQEVKCSPRTWPLLVGLLLFAAPARAASSGHEHAPAAPAPAPHTLQVHCPVMTGNKINTAIFTIYKGKKVYFCCLDCKGRFEAEPEKYLARLPQFAEGEATHAEAGEHIEGLAWGALLKPLGITTLALLLLTAGAGLFRRRSPRLLLKCHKAFALLTVLAALCHAALVLLFH